AGDASAAVVREIRSDRGLDEVGRRTGERVGVVGDSSSEPSAVSGDDASFEARVGSELDAEPTSLKGGGAILDHASDQSGSGAELDRKSTRLNSSHVKISYAVFCLKKKIIYEYTT